MYSFKGDNQGGDKVTAIIRQHEVQTATIPIGTTTSNSINTSSYATGGLQIPAAMTGTAITFLVSEDNVTFTPSYTAANAATSITVGTSRAYPIPAEVMAHAFFQIVSGSTETAARAILVNLKG